MATSTVIYLDDLRCELQHEQSKQHFHTDAPIDNKGKGAAFSPTDLLATSLAACMLTIMGIYTNARNESIKNSYAKIQKIMSTDAPRRVSEIHVSFHIVSSSYEYNFIEGLKNAAKTCPVALSLSKEIKQVIDFNFENQV
jgi:putative redox protein